ncbi:hypothetical protein ElyMa_003268400 [Elysia marginata]|uniref:Uncharacterized protein n=1 Tax=Elysia marginata TaxID=1093978 RepID=A0AAV4J9Q1_9GAST|nr:hypothetical protein ElyMa_003268400 [Elysia marginata]
MGSYCYCCMGWTQIRLDLLYIRSLLLHHNSNNNFLLLLHAIFTTKRCCLTVGFRFQCGRRSRQKNVGSGLTVGSGVCVDLAIECSPLLLTSLQSTFAVGVASVHLLLFWSGVRPGILTSCLRYLVAEGLDLPGVLSNTCLKESLLPTGL